MRYAKLRMLLEKRYQAYRGMIIGPTIIFILLFVGYGIGMSSIMLCSELKKYILLDIKKVKNVMKSEAESYRNI